MTTYAQAHARSIADPQGFWLPAADAISWTSSPTVVRDDSAAPLHRWFPDARLNTCFNALDRHVGTGRGEQPALIHVSPVTGSQRTFTYAELLDEVARFAGVLAGLGVGAGDRVVLSMPMVPEAVIGMLACARLGAVHSVVFGGFAAEELAVRIDDAQPKVVLSASCGIEPNRVVAYKPLLDEALALATHQPSACVILQRPQLAAAMGERDHDWAALAASAEPVGCTDVAATDPLYILYTSGTTGRPKGIVRDNGGHAVALAWSMANVYDIGPGDVWWAASDVGWVVGHSYIVYAPADRGGHDRPVRGQAGRHAGRGGLLAGHRRAQGEGAVHRTHGDPRDPPRGPGGRVDRRPRHLQPADAVPGRRAARSRTPTTGRRGSSASRSWTTGGRPRPDGRSRRTLAGWSPCRSRRVRRRSPSPGTTCGCWTARATRSRRAPRATS